MRCWMKANEDLSDMTGETHKLPANSVDSDLKGQGWASSSKDSGGTHSQRDPERMKQKKNAQELNISAHWVSFFFFFSSRLLIPNVPEWFITMWIFKWHFIIKDAQSLNSPLRILLFFFTIFVPSRWLPIPLPDGAQPRHSSRLVFSSLLYFVWP